MVGMIKKRNVLSRKWKRQGVMDDKRGDGTETVEMAEVEREESAVE